ncbi:MAG: hypothetical protein WD066_05590 [Planctomycetaceae bacterium]
MAACVCLFAFGSPILAEDASATPLDRLKARSAEERWQELRTRLHDAPASKPDSKRRAADATSAAAPRPRDASLRQATAADSAPIPRTAMLPPDHEPATVLRTAPPERVFIETAQPESPRIDDVPRPLAEFPDEAPAELPQLPGRMGGERATSNQLKRVTDILPFLDYEPDPQVAATDPCHNLCPRPDGEMCKPLPDGRQPQCPVEVPIEGPPHVESLMPGLCFNWEATNLFHNPLYFEDAQLERYGHTYHHCVQPFVSAGKFGGQLLGLPYQMAIDPMWERRYVLGWYRPGDCAPHLHHQVPFNAKAAAVQGGAMTGLFFLIP